MPAGGEVIEFADKDYLNPVFETLATMIGHRHRVIFQEGIGPSKFVDLQLVLGIIRESIQSK
jgi:hypothetical protein